MHHLFLSFCEACSPRRSQRYTSQLTFSMSNLHATNQFKNIVGQNNEITGMDFCYTFHAQPTVAISSFQMLILLTYIAFTVNVSATITVLHPYCSENLSTALCALLSLLSTELLHVFPLPATRAIRAHNQLACIRASGTISNTIIQFYTISNVQILSTVYECQGNHYNYRIVFLYSVRLHPIRSLYVSAERPATSAIQPASVPSAHIFGHLTH